MTIPDVEITIRNRYPPHTYVAHLRLQKPPHDCYVLDFEVVCLRPEKFKSIYRFYVTDVLGRTAAKDSCLDYLEHKPGYDCAYLRGCRYVP